MSEELKLCPFCGSEAEIRINSFGDCEDTYTVDCKNCACDIGNYNTEEDAINAWNNRPSPWHTGTPAEEGWYLIELKQKGGWIPYDVAEWKDNEWGRPLNIPKEEVLAWQ